MAIAPKTSLTDEDARNIDDVLYMAESHFKNNGTGNEQALSAVRRILQQHAITRAKRISKMVNDPKSRPWG